MRKIYLTQSNVIRGLTKEEYSLLRDMCRYSNNLYNVALYNVRQYYFKEKKFLKYESNYHECKDNENYKLIQAGVAQQILKVVDRNFKSFFQLIRKAKDGKYKFKDIKIPYYRHKGGMFPLILSTNAISITDGYLTVPMSKAFLKAHSQHRIKIPFPKRLESKPIKEVRILPICNGRYFKVQYCYLEIVESKGLNKDNVLAIDIGLNNLTTCVTNIGTSFIMDGRKLKSINQYWNRQKAYYQSIANRQGLKTTKRLQNLTCKRNNRANDYIRKVARYIINYCIENNIGTVVCGYNTDFTRNIKLGNVINQQFTQISFSSLRIALKGLCEKYDMQYIEQEESYTSQANFLNLDFIPVYNPNEPYNGTFSGKRVKRGLYRTVDGVKLNADLNGAANILRKSKQNFDFEELCRGLLASPLRISVT